MNGHRSPAAVVLATIASSCTSGGTPKVSDLSNGTSRPTSFSLADARANIRERQTYVLRMGGEGRPLDSVLYRYLTVTRLDESGVHFRMRKRLSSDPTPFLSWDEIETRLRPDTYAKKHDQKVKSVDWKRVELKMGPVECVMVESERTPPNWKEGKTIKYQKCISSRFPLFPVIDRTIWPGGYGAYSILEEVIDAAEAVK